MNVKFMFLFSPNFLTYVTKNMKDHSDVSYGQDQKYTHAHAHDSKHTHSWHMRKGSSSGEEVRESPVFVYQRQGGANLIPRSVQLKHALMPPLLLQDFLSLCFSLHVHECVSVFLFFFCVCVHLSGALRRPGVEAGHKKEHPKKIREDST